MWKKQEKIHVIAAENVAQYRWYVFNPEWRILCQQTLPELLLKQILTLGESISFYGVQLAELQKDLSHEQKIIWKSFISHYF
jgi:hypothetical protein